MCNIHNIHIIYIFFFFRDLKIYLTGIHQQNRSIRIRIILIVEKYWRKSCTLFNLTERLFRFFEEIPPNDPRILSDSLKDIYNPITVLDMCLKVGSI